MYSVGVRDFASSSPLQVNWIIILVKVHAILLTMNITNKEHFISSFMDSSGIGLIMGRYKKASLLGGQVILTHISPQLDRIFSLSGLYKILKKAPDIPSALGLL